MSSKPLQVLALSLFSAALVALGLVFGLPARDRDVLSAQKELDGPKARSVKGKNLYTLRTGCQSKFPHSGRCRSCETAVENRDRA